MTYLTIVDRIKDRIAGIAFIVMLWALELTQDEYRYLIYQDYIIGKTFEK